MALVWNLVTHEKSCPLQEGLMGFIAFTAISEGLCCFLVSCYVSSWLFVLVVGMPQSGCVSCRIISAYHCKKFSLCRLPQTVVAWFMWGPYTDHLFYCGILTTYCPMSMDFRMWLDSHFSSFFQISPFFWATNCLPKENISQEIEHQNHLFQIVPSLKLTACPSKLVEDDPFILKRFLDSYYVFVCRKIGKSPALFFRMSIFHPSIRNRQALVGV